MITIPPQSHPLQLEQWFSSNSLHNESDTEGNIADEWAVLLVPFPAGAH